MLKAGKTNFNTPKISTVSNNAWMAGVVTALDDGRVPIKGLLSANNMILTQDGVITVRPGLARYLPAPTGTVLGRTFLFQSTGSSPENWLINLQKDSSGVVKAYVAKPSDTTWTVCNGGDDITFDANSYGRFFQIADKIMILTGHDTLAYFDISTVATTPTVVQYEAIADVAQPTGITNSGTTDVTTGTSLPYTLYYAITANSSVGQTTGTAKSIAVNTPRNTWDPTKNGLKITWTAVTGAKSYNIYCAVTTDGTSNPQLFLLAGGISADNTSYVDNNSLGLSSIVEMPTTNSTAGPICTYGTEINGQAWLWGDTTDQYMVRFGGTYGHELDFSGANNSGFAHVGTGASERPMCVTNFRSGPGDPEIKVLSSDNVSDGKRYTLTNQNISIGDESTFFWQVSEDYGKTGTPSPDAVITYGNSLYFPARGGFQTTGTKPQLQNLLDTETFTDSILSDLNSITWSAMDKAVGLGLEGRLYFCLPINSDSNNQIWVCDLERQGAWMKPWNIAADDMFVVRDSDGRTHHVVLSNNNFYELSTATKSNDDGTAFISSGETGLNYFDEDGEEWFNVIRFDVTILRPRKHANFTFYGYTDSNKLEPIGTGSFDEDVVADTGYGWGEAAWSDNAWSETNAVPDIQAVPSLKIPIEIGQDLLYWQMKWDATASGADYSISKVTAVGMNIGIKN